MKDDIQVKATGARVNFSVSRVLFDELYQIEQLGLLTYEEVAEQLRISKAMVNKMVGLGQLKPVKIGHRAFVKRAAVTELAERGTKKARKAR